MKYAVIGSRSFRDYNRIKTVLESFDAIDVIVSGGASGADILSERFAEEKNIPTEIYLPDWDRYGRSAGIIRNKSIIDACDIVIAFWDGRSKGTKNSIDLATKQGKVVKIFS